MEPIDNEHLISDEKQRSDKSQIDILTDEVGFLTRAAARIQDTLQMKLKWILVLGALAVVLLTISIAGTVQSYYQRSEIQSCIDPKGECYKEGQQRTADAVTQINKAGALENVRIEIVKAEAIVNDTNLPSAVRAEANVVANAMRRLQTQIEKGP